MKIRDILKKLNELAPFEDAQAWDNPGLLVGDEGSEVTSILVALDASGAAIEEAQAKRVQLIITHHPLIFGGLKKINNSDFTGSRVLKLAASGIGCIAMHTNYDAHVMTKRAAGLLGLSDMKIFAEAKETGAGLIGFGAYGGIKDRMSLKDYASEVRQLFELSNVRYYGDPEALIKTAAIVPGSGAEFVDEALLAGADVLITGDVKYHTGFDAAEKGLNIIDAGHYGIEKIFIDDMKDYIERSMPGELSVCTWKASPAGSV